MAKVNVLALSLNTLELDARDNAQLMGEWGDNLAAAKKKHQEQKNRTKLVYARLDSSIRAAMQGVGEKITEKNVESAILQSQEYQAEQQELVQAEYDEERIQNMVWAIKERGEQIGNLAKLHGQMYWIKPDVQGMNTAQSREAAMAQIGGGIDLNQPSDVPPQDLSRFKRKTK